MWLRQLTFNQITNIVGTQIAGYPALAPSHRATSGADAFVRKLGQLCLEPFHILRKQSAYKNENTSKKLIARDFGYKILTILCLQRVVKAGRANGAEEGRPRERLAAVLTSEPAEGSAAWWLTATHLTTARPAFMSPAVEGRAATGSGARDKCGPSLRLHMSPVFRFVDDDCRLIFINSCFRIYKSL